MFEYFLYIFALAFLVISYLKDREKAMIALTKSWKAFLNILPAMAGVLALIGLILSILTPENIEQILGQKTGIWGMVITSLIGAFTLIPGFVAFSMASSLLAGGAGIMQIAVFVSTLTMVGNVTAPMESKYFGWKVTILRNGFAYIISFIVAIIIGVIIK